MLPSINGRLFNNNKNNIYKAPVKLFALVKPVILNQATMTKIDIF